MTATQDKAHELEMVGARRAYDAGFGAPEWAAFLNEAEWAALQKLRAAVVIPEEEK